MFLKKKTNFNDEKHKHKKKILLMIKKFFFVIFFFLYISFLSSFCVKFFIL